MAKKKTADTSAGATETVEKEPRFKDERGRFAQGHAKRGGRQKGGLNRFTLLRNAFLDAFDDAGGAALIRKMLKSKDKEERRFALSLIAKMLPTVKTLKVGGDEDSPPVDVLARLPDEQLERIVKEALAKGKE